MLQELGKSRYGLRKREFFGIGSTGFYTEYLFDRLV